MSVFFSSSSTKTGMHSLGTSCLLLTFIFQFSLRCNAIFYTSSAENDFPRIGKRLSLDALYDDIRSEPKHVKLSAFYSLRSPNNDQKDSESYNDAIESYLVETFTESPREIQTFIPSEKHSKLQKIFRMNTYDDILLY